MITAPESLQSVFDRAFGGISQVREAFTPQLTSREVGTIISVATGIAKVSGLPSVGFEELVKFPGDVLGIAFNVYEDVHVEGNAEHIAGKLYQLLKAYTGKAGYLGNAGGDADDRTHLP